tara:strand:+ start:675 stop:1031 length:357 start_codon:yes stop_codon:yes gene_type:complete
MTPEKELHLACAKILDDWAATGTLRWFASGREHVVGQKAGRQARQMGMKAGIPDLIVFPVSRETIFIELKSGKGTLGELQVEWRDWLLNAGYDWHLIRDVSTFSRILESRLGRLNGVV